MFRQLKKPWLQPHCCNDHWSGSPGVCRQRRHLPDMGTSAGSTLSIGQESRWATIMSASYAVARR